MRKATSVSTISAEEQDRTDGGGAAAPRRSRGLPARVRGALTWRTVGLAALLAVLIWLIVIPMLTVVWGSFRDGPPATDAGFTLSKYIQAYTNPRYIDAAWNSVVFATGSALLSFVAGTYLAWVTERTNAPLRGAIYALVLFPIVVPGILTSIGWVLLLNPNIGLVNEAAVRYLGADGPLFNVYSMPGMIWIMGIENISVPFLLMAAALRSMDPSLEEASAASGAVSLRTFSWVTLPILRPAIGATLLLLFVRGIEVFEVPAVAGIPAGITVFSTEIWVATTRTPVDMNLAAAFAMAYLAVTAIGLSLYYRSLRVGERFATVTGKGFRPARLDLGGKRYLATAIAFLILFSGVVLPLLVITWSSLIPFYQFPAGDAFDLASLSNYRAVLDSSTARRAFTNNLVVGLISSVASVLLAAVISTIVLRSNIRGRKLLDGLAFAPIAIPGIVMGLALLWLYLLLPLPLYGTLVVLVFAFVGKYIPWAMRSTHAALSQIGAELEEASAASGASGVKTFFQVTLPLAAPGLFVGFVFVLSLTFKVLSIPVLLSSAGNELLPVLIFDYYEGGQYGRLAALGMMIVMILLVLSSAGRILQKRVGISDDAAMGAGEGR